MILTDEEKAMLDGQEGLAVQKAMEILVHYGEALGAERLVDTRNVGGYLIARKDQMKQANTDSFDTLFSQLNIDSDEPFEFGRVKVPSCQFETDMEPDYYRLSDRTEEDKILYERNMDWLRKIGVKPMCTCTPYQVGNVPVRGEHCAWMESSAVVYINSVLGARTNCEGTESTTAAMLTGKIPYWGYHCDEHRRGTHLIHVETPVLTQKDWGLLGYWVGKIVQDKVPVLTGIDRLPVRDMLKHFGAAAASAGGIEMYHIPGITADAHTVEEALGGNHPVELKFGPEEKRWAYELLNSCGTNTDVDFVMLGCPHYSIDQVEEVARLVEGRHIKDGVAFWVFVPQSIRDLAVRCGYVDIIEQAGGLVMRDCCPALGQFKPKGAHVMATDSGKQAHYLPNFTGIESWYGSVEECVEAAVTGHWGGEL